MTTERANSCGLPVVIGEFFCHVFGGLIYFLQRFKTTYCVKYNTHSCKHAGVLFHSTTTSEECRGEYDSANDYHQYRRQPQMVFIRNEVLDIIILELEKDTNSKKRCSSNLERIMNYVVYTKSYPIFKLYVIATIFFIIYKLNSTHLKYFNRKNLTDRQ